MVLRVIDGDGMGKGNEFGARNTLQERDLIIPANIQLHIDAILADPENCVDYINGLDEIVRRQILEVFKQIQKIL